MDRSKNKDRWFRFRAFWPIGLMAIIMMGSGSGQPASPGWLSFPHFDKVVHFFVFGLVATAVYRALPHWLKRRVLFAIVIVSLFGVADEVRQSFNPERTMNFADWLADISGATVAVLAYTRWPFYRNLLESPVNPLKIFHGGRGSSQTR